MRGGAAPRRRKAQRPPSSPSRFERVKCIGRGAYGEALLVRQRVDGQLFVIKRICVEALSPKQRASAINEAQLLSALNHCNIIGYHTAYTTAKHLSIVLDYADGGDLSQRIEERRAARQQLNKAVVLDWFAQICSAMHYVHSQHILHRDLKAANIFLTKDLVIKLGDFGIAKALTSSKALAETVIGTPYYMSPELCEDQPYGEKSDVWAMGCVLYELTCLVLPFTSQNMAGLVVKILRGRYAPIPATYGDAVATICGRMLARDPRERPSVGEILADVTVAKALLRFEKRFKTLSDRAARARRPVELDATVVSPRILAEAVSAAASPLSASPLSASPSPSSQPSGLSARGRASVSPSPSRKNLRDALLRQASQQRDGPSPASARRHEARRSRMAERFSPAAGSPSISSASPAAPHSSSQQRQQQQQQQQQTPPLRSGRARKNSAQRGSPRRGGSPAAAASPGTKQRRRSPLRSARSAGAKSPSSMASPGRAEAAAVRELARREREEELRCAALAKRQDLELRRKLFRKEKRLVKVQQEKVDAERRRSHREGLAAAKQGRSSLKDELRARRRRMRQQQGSDDGAESGGVEVLVPEAFKSALLLTASEAPHIAMVEVEECAVVDERLQSVPLPNVELKEESDEGTHLHRDREEEEEGDIGAPSIDELRDLNARMEILAQHFERDGASSGSEAISPAAAVAAAVTSKATAIERMRENAITAFGTRTFESVYAYLREIGAAYDTDPDARERLAALVGPRRIRKVDLVSMLIAAEDIEDAMLLATDLRSSGGGSGGGGGGGGGGLVIG